MGIFKVHSDYLPSGDQPEAIRQLTEGLKAGKPFQTLLGVTGSGKTFTLANVLQQYAQTPVLVLSHNKTLAAQLYSEFKGFLPQNAVEYFVSYYDYYLPESYIPQTDTYIAKDSSINDDIERLRMSATASLLERKDTLVVASVSCIYGLTSPVDYDKMCLRLNVGDEIERNEMLLRLVTIQYERNDMAPERGQFRARGETIEVWLAQKEEILRIEFFGDSIDSMARLDPVTHKVRERIQHALIFPARHFVIPQDQVKLATYNILEEMKECVKNFEDQGKLVEAQRLFQRVTYDVDMMRECGYCSGIENYSRHLAFREPGSRPYCLLDFFPKDYILLIDESHVTLPQLQAMYRADRNRKQMLVDYGFRLPSALDNRPLQFEEFLKMMGRTVFVSATPGNMELEWCQDAIVEQVVRPTGLLDPPVEIRPLENQIDDVIEEIRKCTAVGARSMVATLTKKSAERIADYIGSLGIRIKYLHSELDALQRVKILNELRNGDFDCIVGINLLREGIDMPELRLVAILDADKEGFLRSTRSLTQVAGRAARNVDGYVILYADNVTDSMRNFMDITNARREKQAEYNRKNHITPKSVAGKAKGNSITDILHLSDKDGNVTKENSETILQMKADALYAAEMHTSYNAESSKVTASAGFTDKNRRTPGKKGRGAKQELDPEAVVKLLGEDSIENVIAELQRQMLEAAENLEFERAADLRDKIKALQGDDDF